jgi:hypothetical protein
MYFIITCDLIQSKEIPKRSEAQKEMKTAVDTVNKKFSNVLLCPFVTVWGDSFQGALKSLRGFYDILEEFENRISVDFRCGIGIGEITTDFSNNVLEMDGPAFHRSKKALDVAKSDKRRVWLQSPNEIFDSMINTILILLYTLKSKWTARQREIIPLRKEGKTYEEIGIAIGKTKQTAYKILQAAQWDEISFTIHTLNEIATKCLENLEK